MYNKWPAVTEPAFLSCFLCRWIFLNHTKALVNDCEDLGMNWNDQPEFAVMMIYLDNRDYLMLSWVWSLVRSLGCCPNWAKTSVQRTETFLDLDILLLTTVSCVCVTNKCQNQFLLLRNTKHANFCRLRKLVKDPLLSVTLCLCSLNHKIE